MYCRLLFTLCPHKEFNFLLTLKSILLTICIMNQNIKFSNKPSKNYKKKKIKASAITCPHEANVNNLDKNISTDMHNSYPLSIPRPRLQKSQC